MSEQSPSFRLVVIVSSIDEVSSLFDVVSRHDGVGVGMMLRDASHVSQRVLALADAVQRWRLPANLVVITNGVEHAMSTWVHHTSQELAMAIGENVSWAEMRAGCSVHDRHEAIAAEKIGARYILYSPVFATQSKPGHPGAGVDALKYVCREVTIPVFALGGIDSSTARECLDAGAAGVATLSLGQVDRRPELEELLTALVTQ